MPFETPHRRRFRALLDGPDESIGLGEAALLIAAEAYWDLDVDHHLGRLEELATRLRFKLNGVSGRRSRVEVMCRFLASEIGLEGDAKTYYDPRNSYLNDVLDRGLGIPIALSVVYLEVARRAGIEMVGVAFPAHFLIRHAHDLDVIVDPFHGARILDRDDAESLASVIMGGGAAFDEALLAPAPHRNTLLRMLRNLQGLHERSEDYPALAACIDLQLMLSPDQPEAHVVRAMAHQRMGALAFAKADFQRYLALAPDGPHLEAVQAELDAIGTSAGPIC